MKMQCEHDVYDYELTKEAGEIYIRYICREGCRTKWIFIGEAPHPDEVEIEDVI